MMTRDALRTLAFRIQMAAEGYRDDCLVSISARVAREAAEALTTPTWLSPNEMRLAADTMNLLGITTADAWTLRARLDAFYKEGPIVKNAGSFAAYLKSLPNGGIQ